MAERLCAYTPCGCQPAPGERYCHPECEEADRRTFPASQPKEPDECRCEHPECNPEAAEEFASDEAPVP